MSSPVRAGVLAAVITLIADQTSKLWLLFVFGIAHRGAVEVTPFFDLVLAWNPGISFGWFQSETPAAQILLMVIKAAAVIALAIWMARSRTWLATVSLGLIIGGLGIFGPSIANGIVSGGPQLGAGAAAGTAIAAGATIAGGIAGAKLAAGAAGSAIAGTATGGARAAGGASGAYAAGAAGKTGRAAAASGLANVAKSAASTAASPLRRAADSLKANYAAGKAGTPANAAVTGAADGPPSWATAMKRRQTMTQGANMASHTLKGGDSHGGGSGPDISDKS